MGRKSDARERLLEAGAKLLGQRPYSSIGVAEICETAGVPKGSFYYFFPSKTDLAMAVIEEHWAWQEAQWARILSEPGAIADRLHELFEFTAEIQQGGMADSGVVAGCLFGNLALELSSTETAVRDRLQEIFELQVAMIQRELAGDDSLAQRGEDALHHLATTVVTQMEGLVLFAKLFRDPAQLTVHWNAVAQLLAPAPAAIA